MNRGEIRWYTFRLPDKRRPVLILTRSEVAGVLNELIVVPATRTIRGIATEVVLTPDDGMPVSCALNFDRLSLAQSARLGGRAVHSAGRAMGRSRASIADRLRFDGGKAG